ncbi:MAG TPA: hypothetical protein VL137_05785, partial [Polyangiaceae bacterium]|nr:hypothetical protein [Polyangiaceae bacterium]
MTMFASEQRSLTRLLTLIALLSLTACGGSPRGVEGLTASGARSNGGTAEGGAANASDASSTAGRT